MRFWSRRYGVHLSIGVAVLAISAGGIVIADRTGSAASVEPIIVSGEPSCSDVRPDLLEAISIPSPVDSGEHAFSANDAQHTLTLDVFLIDSDPPTQAFNWSSTLAIEAIIVQSTTLFAHIYIYDPPREVMSDTMVQALTNFFILDLKFCYDMDADTPTGTSTAVPTSTPTITRTPTPTPTQTATPAPNTLPGPDVAVDLGDVDLMFDNVTGEGATTVEMSSSGPPAPDGFQLGDPPVYYDISTTATFTGLVDVCIDYDGSAFTPAVEAALRLFHEEAAVWGDVTTSLDTVADRLCGEVTDLSLFAAAELIPVEDFDEDGCTASQELGDDQTLGGRRDPLYFWDFFDVWTGSPPERDRAVSISDIGAIVARFGSFREPPPSEVEALGEALDLPAPAPAYHPSYDRGGPLPGQNLWNLQPPNGSINIVDIGAVVAQFGHSCA